MINTKPSSSYYDSMLLQPLSASISQALSLDKASQRKMQALNKHWFLISIKSPDINIYLKPGIKTTLQSNPPTEEGSPEKISASIAGELADWIALLQARDKTTEMINGNMKISGDSQLLTELSEIADDLDIDWEKPLTNIIGDIPTFMISQAFRKINPASKQLKKTAERSISNLIHEELQLSPTKIEVENFYRSMRELELNVERKMAEVKQLKKKLANQ